MATTSDILEALEKSTVAEMKSPSTLRLIERALKTPMGDKFLANTSAEKLTQLVTNATDKKTFLKEIFGSTLKSHLADTVSDAESVLEAAVAGTEEATAAQTALDAAKKASNEAGPKVEAYISKELALLEKFEEESFKLAKNNGSRHVIDEALSRFGSNMPKSFGPDSINTWARGYEKRLELLKDTGAAASEIEIAEHMNTQAQSVAEKLKATAARTKLPDGTYKNGQAYEATLNGLNEESNRLKRVADSTVEKLEKTFKGAVRDVKEAFKPLKEIEGLKGNLPEMIHHDVEHLAQEVTENAAKLGGAKGEFTGRFARTVSAVAGEAKPAIAEAAKAAGEGKGVLAFIGRNKVAIGAAVGGLIAAKLLFGGNNREATQGRG